MKISRTALFMVLAVLTACQNGEKPENRIKANIPDLAEVSGVWVSADTVDMEPSVRNFRGQALLNRDLCSVSWFVSAPYSGGYHTGVLRIDGEVPMVNMFRWMPDQAIRKGELNNYKLFSTVKMIPDVNAMMWDVSITNTTDSARELDLSLDMIGFISKYGGDWQWWYPYPKLDGKTTVRDEEVENVRRHIGSDITHSNEQAFELIDGKPTPVNKTVSWPSDKDILGSEKYTARLDGNYIVISDTETDAVCAYGLTESADNIDLGKSGGTARWKKTLAAGESFRLSWIMTYGDNENVLRKGLDSWIPSFDSVFTSVETTWNERWQKIFQPGNDLLSGSFPVLETEDELAKRVYYNGPLTMLYMINTNLPQHKKVFLTGGPRWGASITFFWDITEWSTLWAVVDPEMMKEHVSSWIGIDPSRFYGQDNFGGKGVGNGYSANYWALFQMVRAYITVSRDFDFLQQEIAGKTVLEHLDDYAMNWKRLALYGKDGISDDIYKLADFGDDEWNLLECVPTYKHIVPSFNIGYAWMMKELAAFYRYGGDEERADQLELQSKEMVDRILELYAGDGVWNSLYPDGKKIEVRHCLDFMFAGRYIPDELSDSMKREMIDFADNELLTRHWMRAQSLKDVAAEYSDRPDHGPLGAFDGWPAGTMDALTRMGYPEQARTFYRALEPVTHEGAWAQSHELWGEHKYDKDARVRIAQRGWGCREASGGISISQVMLKDFFGFYPAVEDEPLTINGPVDFNGKLYHVKYGPDYYTLTARNGRVKMVRE